MERLCRSSCSLRGDYSVMTPIEEIFYKMLTNIHEESDCFSIYGLKDLYDQDMIVHKSDFDYVIQWKESIDNEMKESNKKLVEVAKRKLTPEEIEAIKKVGL